MCLIYISISSSSPSIHPSIIHHTFVYLPIWEQTMYKLTVKFPFSGLNTIIILWSYTGSKVTCSQKRNQISNSKFLNHIYFQGDCWDQLNLVLTVTRLYVEMICAKQTNIPKIGLLGGGHSDMPRLMPILFCEWSQRMDQRIWRCCSYNLKIWFIQKYEKLILIYFLKNAKKNWGTEAKLCKEIKPPEKMEQPKFAWCGKLNDQTKTLDFPKVNVF